MKPGDAIKKLLENNGEIYCAVGSVVSVNLSDRTCEIEPLNGGATIYDVRLQADVEGVTGYWIIPKVASNVIVGFLNDAAAVVLMATDIDKLECVIEDMSIQITKDGIVLNGGTLGGLVKVEALTQRLNAIEEAFNGLLNDYEDHNHIHPQGNTTSLVTPYTAQPIQSTSIDDIVNEKVKQ